MNAIAIVTVAHRATDGELALTPVRGEALLTHTVRGLLAVPEIDLVLIAAPQRCAQSFSEVLADLIPEDPVSEGPLYRVVPGSLRQAVAAVEPEISHDSVFLVHDALRAFIPASTVRDVLHAVGASTPVVVPVLPMADTVKVTDSAELIVGTRDRARLRTAQTPIGFTAEAFAAFTAAGAAEPDLAAAVAVAAATVPGHPDAMRVTSGFELSLAEAIAAAPRNEETL